ARVPCPGGIPRARPRSPPRRPRRAGAARADRRSARTRRAAGRRSSRCRSGPTRAGAARAARGRRARATSARTLAHPYRRCSRVWTELLAVTTPSRRELAVAFVALLLAGAALFGPQVAGGGFYWDDWQNSANVHIAGDPGLFSSLDRGTLRPVFGYRPVLTVMLVVEHWALGQDKHLHLAMAVVFGVLTAWALYLLLRVAGLPSLDSAVPAALLLAFPWADSTRMWATASFDTLAVG